MPNIANIQNNALSDSGVDVANLQPLLTNPVTGTGTSGQVAYWNGTNTQTGSNNLFWDAANGRLGYQTTTPLYLADFLQTSTQALAINSIGNAVGRSFFFGYDTGTARRGIIQGVGGSGIGFIQSIDTGAAQTLFIQPFGGVAYISRSSYFGSAPYGTLRIIDPNQGVQLGLFGFNVTDNLIRLKGASGQTGDLIQFRDSSENVLSKFDSVGSLGLGFSAANSARLHVRGSGTTSATTALLVQNSTPSDLLVVRDDGIIRLRGAYINLGTDVNTAIGPTTNGTSFSASGTDILFGSGSVGAANACGNFNIYGTSKTNTSSTSAILSLINGGFSPISGTGLFNVINISSNITINQTGGANGITRGLYVNPTLTSAADWRSIETSNNTGYAAYFAGSADLFLGNGTDIQIGTTTGTKIGTATTQKIGFFNATPVGQRQTTSGAATLIGGGGTALTDTDTFDGYTLATVVKALRDLGLLA